MFVEEKIILSLTRHGIDVEAFIEDADWSFQEELEQLKEEITHVADQLRADETKKMVNLIEVRHGRIWLTFSR
jgi:hypothetical protein